jgi:flagellar hook-length control protein FliK
MQSTSVNASQLLSSFLGGEKEKIGQGIVESDFTGELARLMPSSADLSNQEMEVPGADALKGADKGNTSAQGSAAGQVGCSSQTDSKQSSGPILSSEPVDAGWGASTSAKAKIKAIEAKAKEQKSLFVTNAAVAATVLSDLQYPAEIIKACKDLRNKDGMISIRDLKSLLEAQAGTGPGNTAQVPADHARLLVESITEEQSGTSPGNNFKPSVQVKAEGSYSPDEFRGLLDNVLQAADLKRAQVAGVTSQLGSAETAQTAKAAQIIETAQVLKVDQTEMLATTVVPSFAREDYENGATGKVLTSNLIGSKPDLQNTKVTDGVEKTIEAVTNSLKSGNLPSVDEASAQRAAGLAELPGMQGTTGGGGVVSPTDSGQVSAPASQQTAGMSVQDLGQDLKYLGSKITSMLPQQQPEALAVGVPELGGSAEGMAAQAQYLAPQVKGVEKQADGPAGVLNSTISQDVSEKSGTDLIKTASAEFPSGETPSGGTANQFAGTFKGAETQRFFTKFDPEGLSGLSGDIPGEQQVENPTENGNLSQQSTVFQYTDSTSVGSPTVLDLAASAASEQTTGISLGVLDPVLKYFGATIVSASLQQQVEAPAADASNAAGSDGGRAGSAQYPAPQVEGAGELAGKLIANAGSLQEGGVFQTLPSGSQSSAKAPAGLSSGSKTASPADGQAATVSAIGLNPASKSQYSKIASGVPLQQVEAFAAEAPMLGGPHESLAAQAENVAPLVKGVEKQAEKPFEASNQDLQSQEMAQQSGTDPVKMVSLEFSSNETLSEDTANQFAGLSQKPETETISGNQGSDSMAAQLGEILSERQAEKQPTNRDSSVQNLISQNSPSTVQSEQLDAPNTDNSARSGFSYYDPYRSAELLQNMHEQAAVTTGSQLVLDMEPDGLGKINIKIGAKKDEISVVALTQSEPVKEALMRHSPELRQDLQNQGLVLGRFSVDVNGEKSGSGNYPQTGSTGGKITTPPKEAEARNEPASGVAVYVTKTIGASQISIFA